MLSIILKAFSVVDIKPKWAIAYLVANLVASVIEAGGLAMVFVFFQVALSPENFGGIDFLAKVYEWLGRPSMHLFLALLSVTVIFSFFVRSILLLLGIWISAVFRRDLQGSFTRKLFRAYLAQPFLWHVRKGTAHLISNVAQHVGGIVQHLILATFDGLVAIITVIILLGTMGFLRPAETIYTIIILGVIGLTFLLLLRRRIPIWGQRQVAATEGVYRTVREALRGIKTVKVQGLEEFFSKRVESCVNELMAVAARQSMVQQVPRILLELILITGVLLVVAFSYGSGASATEVVPTMALFGASAIRVLPHINRLLQHLQNVRLFAPTLNAISGDLSEIRTRSAESWANAPQIKSFETLELRNVSFAYSEDGSHAIAGCSTLIRRGEKIAIVGLSGAGKTTLADIILGLFTPTSGEILVDGQAMDPMPYSLFAYVPQENFIVNDTLERNIALGQKQIDPVAMQFAVNNAALNTVVANLPHGMQTMMNEEGSNLSGGERQRLGIARAIYRNAPILVMDEPTSALDALTEAEVSSAIERLDGGKTIVLIAHRLSTIKTFDRIIFVAEGVIVAEGTFDYLYKTQSQFKTMVDFLSFSHKQY